MGVGIFLLWVWCWLPWPQGEAEKAQFARAVSLQQAGQFAEAAGEYRSILTRHPDWLEARANLGVVLGRLGRYEEAVAACLLYTSPSPRDLSTSRMPSSA